MTRYGSPFLFLAIFLHSSNALPASAAVVTELPTVGLSSSSRSQLAVLDGAEWNSIQNILRQEKRLLDGGGKITKYGYMTIVTGRSAEDQDQRVVAMQAPNDANAVYADSIAIIPDKVSDDDAISTYLASLSTIQPVLPRIDKVGGSDESSIVGGKSVVLGSNELACFAAEGLASLGVDVSLVSNGNPNVKKNVGKRKFFYMIHSTDRSSFMHASSKSSPFSPFFCIFSQCLETGSRAIQNWIRAAHWKI
jgi:hypothetical protein